MRILSLVIGLVLFAPVTTHALSYTGGPIQYAPGAHQGGYTLIPTTDWVNGVGCTTCRPNLSYGTGVGNRTYAPPMNYGPRPVAYQPLPYYLYPDHNGRQLTPFEFKRYVRRQEIRDRSAFEKYNGAEYGLQNAQGIQRDYSAFNNNRYGDDGYYGFSKWNLQGNQGYYNSNLYSPYEQGYYGSEVESVYGRSTLNRNAYGLSMIH